MADFSQLPEDILDKIITHHLTTSFTQRIAFAGVCKSWRSVALLPHNLGRRGRPGILMSPKLLPGDDDIAGRGVPCIRSPHHYFSGLDRLPTYRRGKYAGWPTASFQEIKRPYRCLASRDGWLLLGGGCPSIHLLNPVTGEKLDLPGLKSIIIHSAFLSSSPDDDGDCYVFVFSRYSSSQLAWCKVAAAADGGTKGWKFAGSEESRVFEDVPDAASFYNEKLYVVARDDVVYIQNNITTGSKPTVREVIPFCPAMKSPSYVPRTSPYACHINDHLYVILLRRVLHAPSEGISFHVYKLLKEDNDRCRNHDDHHRWERVQSLDGHAVFLGTRQCFSVPVDGDVVGDILQNRIYFTLNGCLGLAADDFANSCWDWCSNDCGVFNVEDGVNECINYTDSSYNNIWFFPMPWNISKHKEHSARSVVRSEGKGERWRERRRKETRGGCDSNDHHYERSTILCNSKMSLINDENETEINCSSIS